MSDTGRTGGRGPSVDAKGNPVVDPSENVKALSEAANKRQDDLREFIKQLFDRELAALRRELETFARHQRELDKAESDRLNSIRQVDREEVIKTAAQSLTGIQTLAAQQNTTAETLRTQVASEAQKLAMQLAAFSTEVNKRLSALELSSSEGKGKQQVSDPALEKLVQRMDTLLEKGQNASGRDAGISLAWAVLLGLFGMAGMLYGILKP